VQNKGEPAANPPAKMAARLAICHSGALKPRMQTDSNLGKKIKGTLKLFMRIASPYGIFRTLY
jgi:hypothetical protein